jgi:RimJ/RimL family protein N-acetyltransferase
MKGPILKGPRITLRPIRLSDATNWVRWFGDPEVAQYVSPNVYKISLKKEKEHLKDIIKRPKDITYSIIVEDGKHIGSVGLHLNPKSIYNAGFGIIIGDKSYWGRGYAGECIKLLGDLAFKKFKINRWQLTVFKENKKAIKAYKKAGFKTEGILRQTIKSRVDGKFHDEYIMSILKEEWKNKK